MLKYPDNAVFFNDCIVFVRFLSDDIDLVTVDLNNVILDDDNFDDDNFDTIMLEL